MPKFEPFDPKLLVPRVLEAVRKSKKWPAGQRAFGKRIGLGEGTIQRGRKGEANLTLDNLTAIAAAVQVEVWQLLVPGFDPTNPPRLAESEFVEPQITEEPAREDDKSRRKARAPVGKAPARRARKVPAAD